MYGECLDFSFVIISYLVSPPVGISPKSTVLVKLSISLKLCESKDRSKYIGNGIKKSENIIFDYCGMIHITYRNISSIV